MAGVQVSGLVSGLNWQNIITQLVAVDSAGMNQVKANQTTVNSQVTALGALSSDLTNLEDSVFSLESPNLYNQITAASTAAGSSWKVAAESGTATGAYTIAVGGLATASALDGTADVSSGLSATSDVHGLTMATIPTAQPITAGIFTVNGRQIAVTTTESLQDIFAAISTATGGTVTGSYDPAHDTVGLASTGGPIVLGAANDTSNFLTAMKLANNGTTAVASTSALGALQPLNPLVSAGIKTALSGQDGSGNGGFTVNGVAISYNVNTDSLKTILGRINNSSANVSAAYDAADDRIVLTNKATGNLGLSVADVTGNLATALGLGAPTLNRGLDATFSVNNGPLQSSHSNSLTGSQLGVTGLSVTLTSQDTQTIAVGSDTTSLASAISTFITNFNKYQTDSAGYTVIGKDTTGAVTTSVLSANHEVGDWASGLQMTTFGAGSALTGAIKSLDNLGIGFTGTTGQLAIQDSAKFQQALSTNSGAVAAFFQTAHTGFGSIMNATITDTIGQIAGDKQNFQNDSKSLGARITTLQNALDAEQAKLTAEFTAMEAAQSQYQNELASLSAMNTGSGSSSSSSSTSNQANVTNSNITVNGKSTSSP